MYLDFRSVNSIKLLKPSLSSSKSWKSIAIHFPGSLWIFLENLHIWCFALEVLQALHSTVVMPFMRIPWESFIRCSNVCGPGCPRHVCQSRALPVCGLLLVYVLKLFLHVKNTAWSISSGISSMMNWLCFSSSEHKTESSDHLIRVIFSLLSQ